jgi:hypothetical protein
MFRLPARYCNIRLCKEIVLESHKLAESGITPFGSDKPGHRTG